MPNYGYNAMGDLLGGRLADGSDMNQMFAEYQRTIDLVNNARDNLTSFLTRRTVLPVEQIFQGGSQVNFEVASEYGEPKGANFATNLVPFGADLNYYDLAVRYTWRFLAEADASEVNARHNVVLEADNRNMYAMTMRRLFVPAQTATEEGFPNFGLYNGDGMVPPAYNGTVFDGTHTHYFRSGAAALDGQDLQDLLDKITEHGYPGQLLIFVNPAEMKVIRSFRAGVGAVPSPADFIPSAGAPAYLSVSDIIGEKAPARFGSVKIEGSFGAAYVSEQALIPAGYVLAVASDGPDSPYNPISFREHQRPALRGLRLVKGRTPDYPLIDSFYFRAAGVGTRHRGAAAVLQLGLPGAYVAPALLNP